MAVYRYTDWHSGPVLRHRSQRADLARIFLIDHELEKFGQSFAAKLPTNGSA